MRWFVRILAGVVVFVIAVAGALFLMGNARLHYGTAQTGLALTVPHDAASIERGRHLASAVALCVGCHTANLGGTVFFDAPPGRIVAANLTRGRGGIGGSWTDADFVRAIRHGIAPDGRPLFIMPSEEYTNLSDTDLADIIAYVRSVPPVDRQLPESEIRPLGKIVIGAGRLPPPPAAQIDHNAHWVALEPASVSVRYGRYLAMIGSCTRCHGAGLSGGPWGPPDAPLAQNITPAGIGNWSEADFLRALRAGKRPDGTTIKSSMPWRFYGRMTDNEIRALRLYLRSVPPRATGAR